MSAGDVVVFIGMGALVAGAWGAFGWPWAAMIGGLLLLVGGSAMLKSEATARKAVDS